MLNVVLSAEASTTLRTFADRDRDEVNQWLEELKSWQPDKFTSRMTGMLLGGREKLYMLRTNSEIRLVFRKDAKTITVIEIIPTPMVRRRVLEGARKTKRAKTAHAS